MMRVYACKQLQVQISPQFTLKPSGIFQIWDFLSVFSIGSMVSCQFCFSEGGPVNQREGQIINEYLAVLVENRIKCETTHTSPDILTEKVLMPWTKATIFVKRWTNSFFPIIVWQLGIYRARNWVFKWILIFCQLWALKHAFCCCCFCCCCFAEIILYLCLILSDILISYLCSSDNVPW